MQPRRISILGIGLLGGSIGLAAKRRIRDCEVHGYAHRPGTLSQALNVGAIQEGFSEPGAAVEGAELVLLCSPVGAFEGLLRELLPIWSPEALVSDVGSTKRNVVEAAQRILPPAVHFVGSHPMAGSEKRGVEFARGDLFEGATCILTPTERTDSAALERMERFWGTLGMRNVRLSPEEHDRRLADVSHMPHAVAAAMVAMQEAASLPLAGKGFLDATRIAAGDGGLWRDIFLENSDNLRESLARLRVKLDELIAKLDSNHADALRHWLDEAALRRQGMKRHQDENER